MGVIYLIGAIIAVFVIVQSVVFLIRGVNRGKAMGMSREKLKKIITSSAVFAIVPSIPIIAGLAILMPTIGLALSWIRLTVIGAVQYELYVAEAVRPENMPTLYSSALGINGALATAVLIMTAAILAGLMGNLLFLKKYDKKLETLRNKNRKWMELLTMAMFMGIIATLGGQQIANGILGIVSLASGGSGAGIVNLLVLLSSMAIMAIFGVLIFKFKLKFLEGFALPVAMLGALLLAYIYVPIFS